MVRSQHVKGIVSEAMGRTVCPLVMLCLLAGCVVYNKEGEVDQEATATVTKSVTDSVTAFSNAAAGAASALLKADQEARSNKSSERWIKCPACKGRGYIICKFCRGRGCFRCSGRGRFPCTRCKGTKWVRRTHR